MRTLFLFVVFASALHLSSAEWTQLPSIPDSNGVAGAFAGTSGRALILAGGANFPDKKPWEGGVKVWCDTIYVLDENAKAWKTVGTLPMKLAYGVSVTHHDSLICIGGCDANQHVSDVIRVMWRDEKLAIQKLPALPKPLAYMSGLLVGDAVFVAGGQNSPSATQASKLVYRLELSLERPTWQEIESIPGPGRILSAMAKCENGFCVVGGAELFPGKQGKTARKYLNDAYRFDLKNGWTRIADYPHPVAAAPTPCPSSLSRFFMLGGDDGTQVSEPQQSHRGFGRDVWRYDLNDNAWTKCDDLPAPRATVPVAAWGDAWILCSGEIRPGIRSPEVWSYRPERHVMERK